MGSNKIESIVKNEAMYQFQKMDIVASSFHGGYHTWFTDFRIFSPSTDKVYYLIVQNDYHVILPIRNSSFWMKSNSAHQMKVLTVLTVLYSQPQQH